MNLSQQILGFPRWVKQAIALLTDLGLCVLSIWFAYYLRLGEFVPLAGNALYALLASITLALPIFTAFGLYRTIFRYSGWPVLLSVARAVIVYGLLYASLFTAIGFPDIPRTVGIIQPILLLLFVGLARLLARVWFADDHGRGTLLREGRHKVLVYGAGRAGRQLVTAMANGFEMQVIGFLDDNPALHGHYVNGLPVYKPADLHGLVETRGVADVLLAMPSIGRARRNEIIASMCQAHVSVRTLPSVNELAQGRLSISDVRDLDIDDLLGRAPVRPDLALLEKNVKGKVVLVTGAGGSIGSELCRQILAISPAQLLLVEQSEFSLYAVHQELQRQLTGYATVLVPLLASVQDASRMRDIITTWRPATLYHAAAYKHVPLVEHNPAEGIRNNVFGTLRTAQVAMAYGVSNVVLISTDKAVRPTNIMGASKRLAEIVLQALAERTSDTKFSMVRFGNVLGSSGSVVPKFRQQIRDGGPITLTHPEITRYFMTIPEASQLVIQAGAMAQGGDVFVLDMGESVKIIDLASRMIELSGLTVKDAENPEGDIEIQITGLRPGEKLYEELLIGDNPKPTMHPRIMKAHEEFIPWAVLEGKLQALEIALNVNDVGLIRRMMQELVTGYVPSDEIVDWVYLEQLADLSPLEATA